MNLRMPAMTVSEIFDTFNFGEIKSIKLLRKITRHQSCAGLKYPASKKIYMDTLRKIERYCKLITTIVFATQLGFVLPKAVHCFYIYFTTDAGPNAFELPLPTW